MYATKEDLQIVTDVISHMNEERKHETAAMHDVLQETLKHIHCIIVSDTHACKNISSDAYSNITVTDHTRLHNQLRGVQKLYTTIQEQKHRFESQKDIALSIIKSMNSVPKAKPDKSQDVAKTKTIVPADQDLMD